ERRRRGEVDAVQVHSDRRIGEGIAAEVADRTNGEGRVGAPARLDLDTGRLARQCLDVRDARIAQVVTTDHGDRESGVLDVLLTSLRGDDDIANTDRLRSCFTLVIRLGHGRRRESRRQRDQGSADQSPIHIILPCVRRWEKGAGARVSTSGSEFTGHRSRRPAPPGLPQPQAPSWIIPFGGSYPRVWRPKNELIGETI